MQADVDDAIEIEGVPAHSRHLWQGQQALGQGVHVWIFGRLSVCLQCAEFRLVLPAMQRGKKDADQPRWFSSEAAHEVVLVALRITQARCLELLVEQLADLLLRFPAPTPVDLSEHGGESLYVGMSWRPHRRPLAQRLGEIAVLSTPKSLESSQKVASSHWSMLLLREDRYDAAKTIEMFSASLRDQIDLDTLSPCCWQALAGDPAPKLRAAGGVAGDGSEHLDVGRGGRGSAAVGRAGLGP